MAARLINKWCLVVGCGRQLTDKCARGLCYLHYSRLRLRGDVGGPERENRESTPEKCEIAGCNKKAKARGMCDMHYRRWRLTGDLGPAEHLPRKPRAKCQICSDPAVAHKLCNTHYIRWKKYGDPTFKKKMGQRPDVLGSIAIRKSGSCRYCFVKMPNHRRADRDGWTKLHWVVYEERNGVQLRKGDRVGFIDGNTLNCSPDNLYLIPHASRIEKCRVCPNPVGGRASDMPKFCSKKCEMEWRKHHSPGAPGKLSRHERECIRSLFRLDVSVSDIAKAFGISVRTVRYHIWRTRKWCRDTRS